MTQVKETNGARLVQDECGSPRNVAAEDLTLRLRRPEEDRVAARCSDGEGDEDASDALDALDAAGEDGEDDTDDGDEQEGIEAAATGDDDDEVYVAPFAPPPAEAVAAAMGLSCSSTSRPRGVGGGDDDDDDIRRFLGCKVWCSPVGPAVYLKFTAEYILHSILYCIYW